MLGWEEWLALPDLGLAAIKAKVDTGAKTSSLHAFSVETFGPADRLKVRFGVHPVPGRDDITVMCTADVVDQREVTSSNGERELRYVITTNVSMGGRSWPVDVTLANRETMAYRMLIGRQAILDDMFVDPAASFNQPKLSYKVYGAAARAPAATSDQQHVALALLTSRPENATNRRIVRAAERRGHLVTLIDRARVSLYIDAQDPGIFVDGRPLPRQDAVIVRAAGTLNAFTLAIVRQLQALGAYAVNSAEALANLSEPVARRQLLAMQKLPVADAAVSHADLIGGRLRDTHVLADGSGQLAAGALVRFAVIGGRALAAIERDPMSSFDGEPDWRDAGPSSHSGHSSHARDAARAIAERAARALGLGLAAVDITETRQGPMLVDITANLSFAQVERLTGTALAEALIIHIEQECRTRKPAPAGN